MKQIKNEKEIINEKEVSKLNEVLQDLELYISDRENKILKITEERNNLYKLVQDKQELISELYTQILDIQNTYDNELKNVNEEKRAIQAIADEYRIKAKRFDELIEGVTKIKFKAEQEALQLVENTQKQSMKTVSIINDIVQEAKSFSLYIYDIKEDIKGQNTIKDRLTGLQDKININISILSELCKTFYIVNETQIPEELYEHTKIANNINNDLGKTNLPK